MCHQIGRRDQALFVPFLQLFTSFLIFLIWDILPPGLPFYLSSLDVPSVRKPV